MRKLLFVLVPVFSILAGSHASASCGPDMEVMSENINLQNNWHVLFVLPMHLEGSRLCRNGKMGRAKQRFDRAFALFNNIDPNDLNRRSSEWQTNNGSLAMVTLGNTIVGAYDGGDGKVFGTIQGTKAEGVWYQGKPSSRPCRNKKYGSNNWGRFVFNFARKGQLTGVWAYCNEQPKNWGTWNGRLSGGPVPRATALRK